jgi:hypothetical protein
MNLQKVDSSNIDRIGYQDRKLIVEYKSGLMYAYNDVPEHVWNEFKIAESKGRFMNSEIKNKYLFKRLN